MNISTNNTFPEPKIKRNSQQVADILRKNIIESVLHYNDRLPSERTLAEQFSVARGTIRQALQQLESSHFVESRPGSGTYVIYRPGQANESIMSSIRPLELVEARRAIEPHICRLAVLHATNADLTELEEKLDQMEACGDNIKEFGIIDAEFHHLMAEVAGNPLLVWMVQSITEARDNEQWGKMRSLTLNSDIIKIYNKQHRRIIEAIRAREPEQAAEAMRDHLNTARESLQKLSDL